MFDTLTEIQAQLRSGEDSFAEFKEIRLGKRSVISPNSDAMAEEMVAFANADGGVLFLGIDDNGEVRGIPETGRWLVRVGSTKRRLTSQELPRLFQQRGRAHVFDEQPVPTATAADLDRKIVERYLNQPTAIPWEELLLKTRVLVRDGGREMRPTVAGLLAFSDSPDDHLLSAKIEAGVYRRNRLDSGDLVHAQTITGPVSRQIEEAVGFVDRFMLRPATKSAEGRLDFPQYALEAIREAVVNAVAHRDYSLGGAKIRLFLFSDRLELSSPGSLPNTMTLDDMPFRVFTRNQLLVSFLSRLYSERTGRVYLESRGEGVRRILEESERHSGRRPEYRLVGEELLLTIWAQPSPHEDVSDG